MKTIWIVVLSAILLCLSSGILAKNSNDDGHLAYCPIEAGKQDNEYIARVQYGVVDNIPISQNNQEGNGRNPYNDFTNFTSSFNTGDNFDVQITGVVLDINATEYFTIWIDWNGNQNFETNEKAGSVLNPYQAAGGGEDVGVVTINIIVPSTAVVGQTRMRIAMKRGAEAGICEAFDFGEYEDYGLLIGNGSPSPNGYCGASGLDASKAFIATVTYGDVSNIPITTATQVGNGPNNYGNFASLSDNFIKGYTFDLSISAMLNDIPAGTYYYSVWIDLNQDGNFETDEKFGPFERIYPSGANFVDQIDLVLNIPLTAVLGTTGMRVAMKRDAEAMACETFLFGEVEDYSIVIDDLPTPPPAPGVFVMLSEKFNGNWTEFGNTFRATYIEKYAIEPGEINLLEYKITEVNSSNHTVVKSGTVANNYGVNNLSLKIDTLDDYKEYRFELIGANKNINQYLYFTKK